MKCQIVKRSIRDEEIEQVLDLADWGMSRKLIATEVYGGGDGHQPSKASLMRVHHILRDYGIRVTDYRNGRNKQGKAMISAIRREAYILEAIRAASVEVSAVIRKTG